MSVSRRGFFGLAAALGAGATVAKAGRANATHRHFEGYPDRFGMLTDTTRCVGCRSCEAACHETHGLPEQHEAFDDDSVFERERRTSDHAYTVVNRYEPEDGGEPVYRKIQCNHCNEPACASACFVAAFTKTPEGPVIYNHEVCLGCKYCVVACPFNIPAYRHHDPLTARIEKCTLCFERVVEGDAPACASICPKEAITFGKRSDLLAVAKQRIHDFPDRYVDHVYGENEVGGTSWLYLSGVPFEQLGMRTDLGTKPLGELTTGFLESVPTVFTLWPGLLTGVYLMSRRNRIQGDQDQDDAVADAIAKTEASEKEAAAKSADMAAFKAENAQKMAVDKAVKKALEEATPKAAQEKGDES